MKMPVTNLLPMPYHLAKKYGSRLHIFIFPPQKELELFSNNIPLKDKKITAEVCVHHLHFTADDYENAGLFNKVQPGN